MKGSGQTDTHTGRIWPCDRQDNGYVYCPHLFTLTDTLNTGFVVVHAYSIPNLLRGPSHSQLEEYVSLG